MMKLDKIYHAAYTLKDVIHKTDLLPAPNIFPNEKVYLKAENLQVTGSFKVRGAYYKISQLSQEAKEKGVIACSAGNHAQGVALAAKKNNINSIICIPDGAPISKVEATRSYGAKVELVKGVYDDAYNRAIEIQKETGMTFIHPFNDKEVIAGQGTIGLEILEQLEDVEVVIVPIGGGGLISGIAFAIKSLKPDCKIYGVQSSGAASMFSSLKEDQICELQNVCTISDGIAVKKPGDVTFDLCRKYVDEVVTVSDDEVSCAILALIENQKLISEGAGAVSVAAAMFHKIDIRNKKTVCVVSGGNIDVTILSRVISRGLLKGGRSAKFTINLMDKPGQLVDVSTIIANLGGNVIAVHHDRGGEGTDLNSCTLSLEVETRDHEHIKEIREALILKGFKFVDESLN
ncbi:MAG: threonine ammonia-lyase [Spirochaetia bacterium]|nr:threonine ammonia-lyase [Spirochaetia bacterium]